jgi:hypothetical protein
VIDPAGAAGSVAAVATAVAAGGRNNPGGGPQVVNRNRAMSFGASSDDIWNADVLDDQLFEFLMDN